MNCLLQKRRFKLIKRVNRCITKYKELIRIGSGSVIHDLEGGYPGEGNWDAELKYPNHEKHEDVIR